MSRLSDLWHGIRSGFDINKMKRDPLGAAGKIAMIYGLTTTAAGALAPEWSARQAKWMRSGFGFYDDPATRTGQGFFDKSGKLDLAIKDPKAGMGFLERSVKGIGGFLASPFEFGNDLRGWYDGKLSWKDVQGRNFGWLNSSSVGDGAKLILGGGSGGRGGSGGGVNYKRTSHRDFRANIPHTTAMNISAAGEGGMYKPGGISQALITGAITPENLRMLGYGSGQVTGSGGQTVDLEDVAAIKTTLRSAIG